MKIERRDRTPWVLVLALLLGGASGCKIGGSDEATEASPVDPGQAAGVVRYGAMEIVETGQTSVVQAVQVRTAADFNASAFTTLSAGTVVNRVARYGGYSLVAWNAANGVQQGWVQAAAAFTIRTIDAGTRQIAPPVFGTVQGTPPPPATTVRPQPTTPPPTTKATAAPPATTTRPVPTQPTTTKPPPVTTKTPATATATASKGFRPPKLGK